MLKNTLISLFDRDLKKVIDEIKAYEKDCNLWNIKPGILNSGGNLALHLLGNLITYIGKNLGDAGYVRDRPLEFSAKNIDTSKIIEDLESTISMVKKVISKMESEDFQKIYPENVLGYEMTTEYFLLHLLAHLNYHLGQLNYHRRLLEGQK
jgi:Protein of unknown function (DUF1572)